MVLIIGGRGQGKHDFARATYGIAETDCVSGTLVGGKKLISHLEDWIAEGVRQGRALEAELFAYLAQNPESILLCAEVGGGLVPIDPHERAIRERTGRLCCQLAEEAEAVWRVYCGLGTRLK